MTGSSARPGSPVQSASLALVAFSAGGMLVLLQAFRVFVPYLVFEVDQSERGQLASIALTVFALTFLGALLVRLIGIRSTFVVAVVAMAAGRLGLQLSEDPGVRWKLGAATVVACFWLLIVILPRAGQSVGFGIAFAFLLDLILRAMRGTLDLPWMPGVAAHVLTLAIVAAVGFSAYYLLRVDAVSSPELPFRKGLHYAGIGSGIALWLVVAGSPGFAGLHGDRSLPGAAALIALGVLGALLFESIGALHQVHQRTTQVVICAIAMTGALATLIWSRGESRVDVFTIPLFGFAVTVLTMRCASSADAAAIPGRWRTGATVTIGMLLQIAFIFLYFAKTGPMELYLAPLAILCLAALAGTGPAPTTDTPPGRSPLFRASAAAAIVTMLTLGWLVVDEPKGATTSAESADVTVMTFNIQEGFSNDNVWSLEETAHTIEAYDPDIVVLQETTLGWLVMSSVDEVRWLANRLGMDYAYAGNSYDRLWGNAILSRLPIVSTDWIAFSTTENLRRSALAIEVETSDGNLLVIDTHLDNPFGATEVRLQQIEELLAFWDGATPAIIAGDFNADPGSLEWQAMLDAGFVDSGATSSETTSEDERRIDYVWITPDLQVADYAVPDVWVSDHRPVVVEVSPSP